MRNNHRYSLAALAASGLLWGTTVPLTKLGLAWLPPGWLTLARFALSAVLLGWIARHRLRQAVSPAILGWGAFGYGMVIVAQNAGIARTSVSHAALIVGATPILIALMAVGLRRSKVGPVSWLGFGTALAGVALIATDSDGGATLAGDGLVISSLLLSAGFVVAQPAMLAGRDPMAVTAVQFAAAAVAALPVAAWLDPVPAPLGDPVAMLAVAGLVLGGTLAPFTLFAYGQARVVPEIAGAFLNLEPLVGATMGVLVFADPFGVPQLVGGVAILGGIALTAAPLVKPRRVRTATAPALIARPGELSATRPRELIAAATGKLTATGTGELTATGTGAVTAAGPGGVGAAHRRSGARRASLLRSMAHRIAATPARTGEAGSSAGAGEAGSSADAREAGSSARSRGLARTGTTGPRSHPGHSVHRQPRSRER